MCSPEGFVSYETAPQAVRDQLESVAGLWKRHLREDLTGVYLHGSLCLGHFVPGKSDLDVLIVVGRKIGREERLAIARDVLDADNRPASLEMSAVAVADIRPWRHPVRCQFHYSNAWTRTYEELLAAPGQASFIVDEDFEDRDIACHARLTRQAGICLCGQPAEEEFPPVPEEDMWDALTFDIDEFDFNADHPHDFAGNILTLARILSYKAQRRILSKYDACAWGMEKLPARFAPILEAAKRAQFFAAPMPEISTDELEAYRAYLVREILVL